METVAISNMFSIAYIHIPILTYIQYNNETSSNVLKSASASYVALYVCMYGYKVVLFDLKSRLFVVDYVDYVGLVI